MYSLIKTPKIQLTFTLLAIALSALIYQFSFPKLSVLVIAPVSTILADLIFVKLRGLNFIFPSAALISGLIIGLLINPTSSWYEVVAVAILAIFIKDFLRIANRHIFNPAGLGLLVGAILFQRPISWWGVSFSPLLILLSPALVSALNMRRWRIIFSFLTTYSVSVSLTTGLTIQALITNLLDPPVLFFALVMAPEPITTPHNHTRQIIFGSLVGLVAVLFSLPISTFLPDPLIAALLLGNILFFYRK